MQDPEDPLPSQPGRTVVLIAEDDVMVRNMACIALEDEGYSCSRLAMGNRLFLCPVNSPERSTLS